MIVFAHIPFAQCKSEIYEISKHFYEKILNVKDQDSYPMVLVGNKCDVSEEKRGKEGVGREFIQENGEGELYFRFKGL